MFDICGLFQWGMRKCTQKEDIVSFLLHADSLLYILPNSSIRLQLVIVTSRRDLQEKFEQYPHQIREEHLLNHLSTDVIISSVHKIFGEMEQQLR